MQLLTVVGRAGTEVTAGTPVCRTAAFPTERTSLGSQERVHRASRSRVLLRRKDLHSQLFISMQPQSIPFSVAAVGRGIVRNRELGMVIKGSTIPCTSL